MSPVNEGTRSPCLRLPRLPRIKGLPRLQSLCPDLRQVDRAFYSLTPSLANAAACNRSRAKDKENPLRRYRSMIRKLSIGNAVRTLLAQRSHHPSVPLSPPLENEPRRPAPTEGCAAVAQPGISERIKKAPVEETKEILHCVQDVRSSARDAGRQPQGGNSSAQDRCSARRTRNLGNRRKFRPNRKNRVDVDQKAVAYRRPFPTSHLRPTTYRPRAPSRPLSAAVKRFARQLMRWARLLFARPGATSHSSGVWQRPPPWNKLN
jgi:hypothetical protein